MDIHLKAKRLSFVMTLRTGRKSSSYHHKEHCNDPRTRRSVLHEYEQEEH